MGIVNVTPDSFSDGGRHLDPRQALARARQLVARRRRHRRHRRRIDAARRGAGRRGRGARARAAARRGARGATASPSRSTRRKPAVMRAALAAGAAMVNDVARCRRRARSRPSPRSDAAVCLMHMQGEPRTMQHGAALRRRRRRGARLSRRARAGVRGRRHRARAHRHRSRLRLRQDAGAQSRAAARARRVRRDGLPGARRAVAQVDARDDHRPRRRATGWRRASRRRWPRSRAARRIVRVHDVRETVDALKVWRAVRAMTERQSLIRQHDERRDDHDARILRHRRHPRTRRRAADHAGPHAEARLGGGARARRRDATAPARGPSVLIGKDTRISGYMLEAALEAGFPRRASTSICPGRCRRPASRI